MEEKDGGVGIEEKQRSYQCSAALINARDYSPGWWDGEGKREYQRERECEIERKGGGERDY